MGVVAANQVLSRLFRVELQRLSLILTSQDRSPSSSCLSLPCCFEAMGVKPFRLSPISSVSISLTSQVETFGAMAKTEKIAFILEQVSCLFPSPRKGVGWKRNCRINVQFNGRYGCRMVGGWPELQGMLVEFTSFRGGGSGPGCYGRHTIKQLLQLLQDSGWRF